MSDFEIQVLEGANAFEEVQDVQLAAWGFGDINVVPAHLLQAMNEYGAGLVIGAYLKGKIVGFVLILETRDKAIQHLHMIGVHPDYQKGRDGINVGESLFRFYGKEALKIGVDEVHWTFDPLLGQNASLYFHKLGARALRYIPDAYSKSSDVGIYRGLPADRLLVSWKPNTFQAVSTLRELPLLVTATGEIGDIPNFALKIPFDINKLKKLNMGMAVAARVSSKDIFTEALSMGYEVIDFICQKESQHNFYIFHREG